MNLFGESTFHNEKLLSITPFACIVAPTKTKLHMQLLSMNHL